MPNLTPDELRRRVAALQAEAKELRDNFTAAVVSRDLRTDTSALGNLFEEYLKAGDRLQQEVERLDDTEDRNQKR
jgi:hypothetical protein